MTYIWVLFSRCFQRHSERSHNIFHKGSIIIFVVEFRGGHKKIVRRWNMLTGRVRYLKSIYISYRFRKKYTKILIEYKIYWLHLMKLPYYKCDIISYENPFIRKKPKATNVTLYESNNNSKYKILRIIIRQKNYYNQRTFREYRF